MEQAARGADRFETLDGADMASKPQTKRWAAGWIWGSMLLAMVALVAGCPAPEEVTLPETLDIEMPDGTVVAARIATGPTSLANSTWACYRKDNDALIVRVEFGADGCITRFFDNVGYSPSHLGAEVFPDSEPHAFVMPANAYYRGAAYGKSVGLDFGAALFMHAWWGDEYIGQGVAVVSGTISGDTFDGVFSYYTQLHFADWFGSLSDQYEIHAVRED